MFLVDKYNDNLNYITQNDNILNTIIDSFDNYNKLFKDNDYIEKLTPYEFGKNIMNLNYDKFRYSNFQHLIIYGLPGSDKKYIINKLLSNIFGKANIELKDVEYTLVGYSNLKQKIIIKQSKHHIIFEPNSNGYDKYLIQEIIQDYAKSEILNIIKQSKLFKVIVINKIDNLSYYAQASLRRTLEKCSNTCKFILVSDQLSNIIEPLRSRCLMIRVPLPSKDQIFNNLLTICYNENIKLSLLDINKFVNKSENKMNHAIWLLNIFIYKINDNNDWKNVITNIVDLILLCNKSKINNKSKIYNIIKKIREYFYILFITNIPTQIIIKKIMINLLLKINNIEIKYKIINITSIFENRLNLGDKHIIHIEAYIIKLLYLIYNNLPKIKYIK
jgi:replication factor C subunit 3/5